MADENWTREYQDGETVPGTPYKVVSLMGAGGMGSVYIVEHIELGRRYVLKSLLRTLAARHDLIARMRNEWRSLGKLRHPNIVDVINAGETPDGVPYYVMELLSGETVRDRLARNGRLPCDQAVRVAQATLLGLAAAHAIGVVHRDVKPANVFLTRDGGVKVLDFGIAQVRHQGAPKITAQGLAIGTPRYMSPEQASGEKADARSDVYAVGLLLYEMIAGEGPFDDLSDITQQMLAHLHRPPRPLHQWAELPDGLEDVIERALAKHPDDRPRSAEYMAAELAPFAGSDRISVPRFDRVSSPAFSPISSPTPPAMVLNTTPPLSVELNPTWREPTMELAPGTLPASPAISAAPTAAAPLPPGPSRGRSVGAWLAIPAGLLIAALAFGFRSPSAPSPGPSAQAARLEPDHVAATATVTPTPNATPTPTPTVTPTPEPVASAPSPTSTKRSRKTLPPSSLPPSTPPLSAEEPPVRLPPSGL
jgi:eukaryotic-like serine/threonine-protein kinase